MKNIYGTNVTIENPVQVTQGSAVKGHSLAQKAWRKMNSDWKCWVGGGIQNGMIHLTTMLSSLFCSINKQTTNLIQTYGQYLHQWIISECLTHPSAHLWYKKAK